MSRIIALLNADGTQVENLVIGTPPEGAGRTEDVTDVSPRPGPGWRRLGPGQYAAPIPVPVVLTRAQLASVFERMTAQELHAWRRAVVRAEATNSPTANDRALCRAWHLLTAFGPELTVTDASVIALKTLWVNAGVVASANRADQILAGEA